MLEKGKASLILAPMEGVTDAPMRAFLTERGGFSFCVSEFLRVSQDVLPYRTFLKHVPELNQGAKTSAGVPVQVQLLGGDPEKLAQTALNAVVAGAAAIDLNFGCPAPTVNRNDGGATLLKFPERIRLIVHTVRKALPIEVPLSAKLRLGWDDPSAIHLNAEMAAEGGASWITIHGRTRMQGYTPPAYWQPIGEVKKRLSIPVVANGEIWTLDDFKRCQEQTQCEHFMLGRGALADPSLPRQIAGELGIQKEAPHVDSPGSLDWHLLLTRYAEIAQGFSDRPFYVPCKIKQWIRMSHLRFPSPMYDRIKLLQTTQQIFESFSIRS